jgi:ATP-binding cassette subfamily B protein
MLTWPVASLGWVSSMVQEAEGQKRLNEFLKPEIKNNNSEFYNPWNHLFENVSYTYEDTNIQALKKHFNS